MTNKSIKENRHGTCFWHLNGQLHRTDGPAIEWSDGDKFWYFYGVKYSFNEYVKKAKWSDEQIVIYKLKYF